MMKCISDKKIGRDWGAAALRPAQQPQCLQPVPHPLTHTHTHPVLPLFLGLHSPDYIASCVNEAAQRRDALRGQQPRTWLVGGGPRNVTDSWEHMWWDHLHWKRWKVPRTGPAFPQDMYWQ